MIDWLRYLRHCKRDAALFFLYVTSEVYLLSHLFKLIFYAISECVVYEKTNKYLVMLTRLLNLFKTMFYRRAVYLFFFLLLTKRIHEILLPGFLEVLLKLKDC